MENLLIDGNNLVWRVYYVAESVNPGGMDGMLHVHMFLSALKNYAEQYSPKRVICCWDMRKDKQPNYRNTLIPDYKEQRDKDKAKVVHCQSDLIQELVEYLGIVNFYPSQLEADDCIAWLCETLPGNKCIVSSDKDMLQLIRDGVVYYDPMKKVEINMANFEQHSKFGYDTFMIEKIFAGDKSDNVPGIHGFGPVKVKKYLAGEVELTEAQKEQYNLNFQVFDLSLHNGLAGEVEHYESQSLKGETDWETFLKVCKENGLNSIVNNKESFYNQFCMDVTLSNMFENLFG